MSDTTYVDFNPPAVNAAWLNDLNNAYYRGTFYGATTYTFVSALSYTDSGTLASFASAVNNYNQVIIQNKTAGTVASTSWNVSNDSATALANYGEFGINSSAFVGIGSFSKPGAVYLAAASTDLVIGTYGASSIRFVTNNGAADAGSISPTGVWSIPFTSGFTGGLSGVNSRSVNAKLADVLGVKDFGAVGDGVTDDTAAIQAAIDAITAGGKPRTLAGQDGSTYKITSTLYVDVSLVGWDFNGATISISSIAAGPAIIFASSGSGGPNQIQPLGYRGLRVSGNNIAGVVAFQYGTLVNVHGLIATAQLPSVTFDRISFVNVDICENYVTQCFDIKHGKTEYESCGATNYVIQCLTGGTNYGENITYDQPSFHNCGNCMKLDYVAVQITMHSPTFDYCNQAWNINNGALRLFGPYYEFSNDTLPQGIAANDSRVEMYSIELSNTGNRVNSDIFTSNCNVSSGFNKGQGLLPGIFCFGGRIGYSTATNRKYLCGGTGANWWHDLDWSGFALSQSSQNMVSLFMNAVANGTFTTGITGWSVVGGVTWNSTGGNGGGGSLLLTYSVDPTSTSVSVRAETGDSVIATYDVSTVLASRFMQVHLYPFDFGGNQLGDSYIGSVGADLFTGTNAYATCQTRFCNLPPGTDYVTLKFLLAGGAAGGLTVNIDNVVVNVV